MFMARFLMKSVKARLFTLRNIQKQTLSSSCSFLSSFEMEILITVTWADIFFVNVTRQICQFKKCCDLIGAATIVAACTSRTCISPQTLYSERPIK